MRSSKVDKRNGALCTQREHALARRQKEYVINSVKGEKKRDKTVKKSRRMLRFIRAPSLSIRDDVIALQGTRFTRCDIKLQQESNSFFFRGW